MNRTLSIVALAWLWRSFFLSPCRHHSATRDPDQDLKTPHHIFFRPADGEQAPSQIIHEQTE